MSLGSLTKHVSVLDIGSTTIGVLSDGESAVLIDSGLEQRQSQKIDKLLNLPVKAIYHTHSHADHLGGSEYFAKKHRAAMYMPAGEMSFAHMPELEGALLYGGLSPAAVRHKFFMASAVKAGKVPDTAFYVYGAEMVPVDLAGHSPAHTGFITEGILFLGDSVFIPEVVEKHGVLYLYNAGRAYETLENILKMDFDRAVLCHKGVFDKAGCVSYIENQMAHINKIADLVEKNACALSADDITREIIKNFSMGMSIGGWLLVLSTIKGYLTMLESQGRVSQTFAPEKGIIWEKG